jgi:hypothetical protein
LLPELDEPFMQLNAEWVEWGIHTKPIDRYNQTDTTSKGRSNVEQEEDVG